MKQAKPIIHGRDHAPGGADPIPGLISGSGLANAVMVKGDNQTIPGPGVAQVTLDSGTFATTDATVFSVSGSDIVIAEPGFYASLMHVETDGFDAALTQVYTKWLTASGGANAPWEQIVPRIFDVSGPAGLQGFQPDGSGLALQIDGLGFAYCFDPPTNVKGFFANLGTASISFSTALLIVVQVCPIDSGVGYPTFPF